MRFAESKAMTMQNLVLDTHDTGDGTSLMKKFAGRVCSVQSVPDRAAWAGAAWINPAASTAAASMPSRRARALVVLKNVTERPAFLEVPARLVLASRLRRR